jgi:preprotein translocase subunit SecA
VYRRRRNALFGERLELDILNLIYDVSEDIAAGHKVSNDYEDFKLTIIKDFGYDTHITPQQFSALQAPQLTQILYDEATSYYESKSEHIGSNSLPLVNDLLGQNTPYENIAVPFTDGRKHMQVIANLRKAQASQGRDIVRQMEKVSVLSTIDEAWTQHLRQMDDLKQVVQNAVYEQKDPLLVYKFEAFELFKRMLSKVNHETSAFLFKADVPVAADPSYTEPEFFYDDDLPTPPPMPKLKAEKAISDVSLGAGQEDLDQAAELGIAVAPPPRQEPVRSQKVANRNDKVTVQYMDGSIKRDVKYKSVEEDLAAQRCVLVD